MKRIYLDNNATTELAPEVREAMWKELNRGPSNPSSIHSFGREAHLRLVKAREQIATYLGVSTKELIFTSGGTESLNLALLGCKSKGHIITSSIEHAAIHHTLQSLENPITYLPVGPVGCVSIENVEKAIQQNTSLIVLSAVNSETGVKNPIEEIADIAERNGIFFVVDGVALLGKEIFSIPKGVSAMAFSGHKIHGPKGVGLLFARKNFPLSPLFFGGGQEYQRRSGTENLVGIIGLAQAIALLEQALPQATGKMQHLRDRLEVGVKREIPNLIVNGTGPRICNTSSLTFPGIDGEGLLMQLDMHGIAASMGSACSAGAVEPSRILLNMGLSKEAALSTLRFSLSHYTSKEEIEKAIQGITRLVHSMSLL